MKAHRITYHLAAASLLSLAVGSFAGACSSNSANNPAPTEDGGGDVTSSSSSGSGSSSGTSSSSSGSGSSSGGLPDTGTCMSDASNCNSCYTTSQAMMDPLNACSPYAVNCIKYDNTKLPGWPNIPQVP